MQRTGRLPVELATVGDISARAGTIQRRFPRPWSERQAGAPEPLDPSVPVAPARLP